MLVKTVCAILAGGAILLAFNTPEERGKDLFARRCSGCHAPDITREGPRLHGVYGRKAASLADFTYSHGLKKAKLKWDEASLDRWLTNPEAIAPDTDMAFRVPSEDERKAIIAYLKTL